ncbi:hypothetical protein FIU86_04795 [Roseovarius sp. THAF9]|nr:hypothetical protein FIU86_04795 [Roseovarius sp. THAF9]
MLYTTIDSYAEATGATAHTASRRMKDLAFRVPSGSKGRRSYPLAAAVQTFRPREIDAGAVPAIAQSAHRLSDTLYVESEMLPAARAFAEWLPDPRMRSRLLHIRNAFSIAVGNSPLCTPSVVRALEPLKSLWALNADVTRFILAGATPPDVDKLAPAFAVSCNEALLENYYDSLMEIAA